MTNADYTTERLYQEFGSRLASAQPDGTYAWLAQTLQSLPATQRAVHAALIAFTGKLEAIAWLEDNVASPVTDAWGIGAALLGTPWPRISSWLAAGGARRLMALDAIFACRSPAPNMSPLHQIAAPVLPEAPTPAELEASLAAALAAAPTPRIQSSVAAIRRCSAEILAIRSRNVAAADLPKLFLNPEDFTGAARILERHAEISGGIRESVEQAIHEHKTQTRH